MFTVEEQKEFRDTFIKESRQKAWGARCHANWVEKGLDAMFADYTKLKEEDDQLETQCQSALKFDPVSAFKIDPLLARIVTEGGRSPTGVTMRASA